MIRIDDLAFNYTKNEMVLDKIHMEISKNQYVIVKGCSGAGKSTLLSCVAGLLIPCSGNINVNDRIINLMNEKERTLFRKQNIAYLPQENCLIDSISLLDNICLPKLLSKSSEDVDKIYIEAKEILQMLKLNGKENKKPCDLSGGEQRRGDIAKILLSDKPVIIMDEPTKGMDDECVQIFNNLIKEFKNNKSSILISTHDDRLFTDAVDREYVLSNKRVK